MANIYDFQFNEMSRIGNDSCYLDQNSIQNSQACSYLLQNYFAYDCEMNQAKLLATSQVGINYSGYAPNECNIEDNSRLLIGQIQSHPRCHIDLYTRPFATVPYLGRGSVDPILESQLMQGEPVVSRKTEIEVNAHKSTLKYQTMPLIPELKQTIQNPNNLVESGWIRGGISTRDLSRDTGHQNQ